MLMDSRAAYTMKSDEFKIRFNSDAKLETVKDIVDYVEANAK